MYRIYSWYLMFRFRLVCPTYYLWQVLHVILYIPLFLCYDVWAWVVGVKSCFSVVVALNAIPTLVFLNMFVIFLILGLWYVNVVQILCFFSLCVWLALLCICWLSLCSCSSWGWACQGPKHVEDSIVTYMLLLNCALKLVVMGGYGGRAQPYAHAHKQTKT